MQEESILEIEKIRQSLNLPSNIIECADLLF